MLCVAPTTPFVRDYRDFALMRDANVFAVARDECFARIGRDYFVGESERSAFHLVDPTAHSDAITIAGGLDIARMNFGDGEIQTASLETGIIAAAFARVVAASLLKIDDVTRMMDNAHGVGFSITHVKRHFRDDSLQSLTPFTALIWYITRFRSKDNILEDVALITRKLAAALALICFALVLASCGGAAPTPTNVPPTQTAPTAVVTEEPTIESTIEATVEATVEATPTAETASTEEAADATAEAETATGDEAPAEGGVMVMISQINTSLRGGPGTAYPVVYRTQVSETFPVVAQFGEGRDLWYQVTLTDGTSAWAWSRVATLDPADAVVPVAEEVPPPPTS